MSPCSKCYLRMSQSLSCSKNSPNLMFWNTNVHFRVIPPPVSTRNRLIQFYMLRTYLSEIKFIILRSLHRTLQLSIPLKIFWLYFVIICYIPMRSTSPVYLVLFDLITQTISAEKRKLPSSSLCRFWCSISRCSHVVDCLVCSSTLKL